MSSKFSYNKNKVTNTALITLVLISVMSMVQLYEKKQRYEIPVLEQSMEASGEEGDSESAISIPYQKNQENNTGANQNQTSEAKGEIIVHIAGEVKSPSVISMAPGSRLYQAVEKAGGLTEKAEQSMINLAQELIDGSQYIIPAKGSELLVVDNSVTGKSQNSTNQEGKININVASEKELESLNGIGPVLAQRIIEHREASGGFKTIDELLDVKGIGDAKFEGLKDSVYCK